MSGNPNLIQNAATALHNLSVAVRQNTPGERWFFGLFWSFWLHLALFPVGYGFREVMPVVSLVCLAHCYAYNWSNSVLARLRVRPLFYCLWLMMLVGIVFSTNPFESLLFAGTAVNKGLILPFIAMECVRTGKDLQRLVIACALAVCWQGLDGVWQAFTGYDFVMRYPTNGGRLTGSLGDYAVGNYIALAMIPAFSIWFVLRQKFSTAFSAFLCFAALWSGFFLLIGAATRAGMLAVAVAFGLWNLLRIVQYKNLKPFWKISLPGALTVCILGALFFLTPRVRGIGVGGVAQDGRWSLWELAWRVFMEHPWFGSGAGQYNAAFRALGLAPAHDEITISHPHNLYLDILYAHGIVGFCLGMVFLLGFVWWGYKNIKPRLDAECAAALVNQRHSVYWRCAVWFWIGFVCWFVHGIFGHEFYRMWYLALSMSYLGIFAGAIVNGEKDP
ncbi:MAG: O-antigen ligase [Candidatus Desulfovibrio kirbyi]|uniref:O-antigen ligase n=1 Tax=Candidatus Desulfovibrio kirbyi TaxID=2696086 RepID=A0A6L2R6V0_9BACT|nr:MAG: O-antigen ligase [Candidatus Desulfovibrio kirbyi]